MLITPRDRNLLARVHRDRVCDASELVDLFPTRRALEQRLWVLTSHRYLVVYRIGRKRAYALGPAGARTVGASSSTPRLSPATVGGLLRYAEVRRLLQSEGYQVDGHQQVGRVRLMRARRDGRRVGVVVREAPLSPRAAKVLAGRLRSLVNPFGAAFDQLILFGPSARESWHTKLPPTYRDRIVLRALPARF